MRGDMDKQGNRYILCDSYDWIYRWGGAAATETENGNFHGKNGKSPALQNERYML